MAVTLTAHAERFPLREAFTISRGSKTETDVVVAELRAGEHVGRGEGGPNVRYDETPASVVAQIVAMEKAVAGGLDRAGLQDAMPPGAARNALDCAFWDLEARRSGTPVWRLAGLAAEPAAVLTAFTLSAAAPAAMQDAARRNAGRPLLK
ncbi:MAG: dipeptide epimerase, partial [Alphaproteobacteria bacterium]